MRAARLRRARACEGERGGCRTGSHPRAFTFQSRSELRGGDRIRIDGAETARRERPESGVAVESVHRGRDVPACAAIGSSRYEISHQRIFVASLRLQSGVCSLATARKSPSGSAKSPWTRGSVVPSALTSLETGVWTLWSWSGRTTKASARSTPMIYVAVPSSGLHRTRTRTAAPPAQGKRGIEVEGEAARNNVVVTVCPRVSVAVPTLSVICYLRCRVAAACVCGVAGGSVGTKRGVSGKCDV